MRRPAPHTVGFIAAALLFVAAVLTLMVRDVALWQPITLFAASVLFAAVGIYTRRQQIRRTP